MLNVKNTTSAILAVMMISSVAGAAEWQTIFTESFATDPAARATAAAKWTYSGMQIDGQDMLRWNAGQVSAVWDQQSGLSTITPSSYSRPLGATLADNSTFRIRAKIRVDSNSTNTAYYQIANFGLYNMAQMGADRCMVDPIYSFNPETYEFTAGPNSTKDGSDFVEFNYFPVNDNTGTYRVWGPMTQALIGVHTQQDGYYIVGTSSDPMFHDTDAGYNNFLPHSTDLYVEVSYDASTRRARSQVFFDANYSTLFVNNGVSQSYYTAPVPADQHFTLTDVAMWNYVASTWNGDYGFGAGSYDDISVQQFRSLLAGDANGDFKVDGADLLLLNQNWDPLNSVRTWAEGDFNGDGRVDGADLLLLNQNWSPLGYTPAGDMLAVPEPVSLSLLVICGLSLLKRRNKR